MPTRNSSSSSASVALQVDKPVAAQLEAITNQSSSLVSPIVIKRKEHKIRDYNASVRWFPSEGSFQLDQPVQSDMDSEPAEVGDLFVHQWSGGTQVWMWDANACWKSVNPGDPHPTLTKHRLQLLTKGEPRWVTKKTQTTYRSRKA